MILSGARINAGICALAFFEFFCRAKEPRATIGVSHGEKRHCPTKNRANSENLTRLLFDIITNSIDDVYRPIAVQLS
jgi:hypothetical protein